MAKDKKIEEIPKVKKGGFQKPFVCPDCNRTGWKDGVVCTTCEGTPVRGGNEPASA
jgi:DnaJ-class molecular chaperone